MIIDKTVGGLLKEVLVHFHEPQQWDKGWSWYYKRDVARDVPSSRAEAILNLGLCQFEPLRHTDRGPHFDADNDVIRLPERVSFYRLENYYKTAFHELIHATGHVSRLNRDGVNGFIRANRPVVVAKEELTAEIGAACLASLCDVKYDMQNTVSYLIGWSRGAVRRSSGPFDMSQVPALLHKAADEALVAINYILDRLPEPMPVQTTFDF